MTDGKKKKEKRGSNRRRSGLYDNTSTNLLKQKIESSERQKKAGCLREQTG